MIDGERVRRRREALGLTQQQAADAANMSRFYWSRIESGSSVPQKYTTLQLIASALGWTLDELLCAS